jgi:uridine kinase
MSEALKFPKFLSNQPCGKDLFASGPQNKIAESIVHHIHNNLTDSNLIGLDGDWGSGKSNVVSIIKKMLGKGYHLFVYDAWSHQEDLQRRSFLEELTENLQEKEIVDQEKWKKNLKELLAKKKETITKTIPKLSYPIIISLLMIVLAPVAKSISDSIADNKWKIILSASPIILALLAWGVAIWYDKKKYLNLNNLFYIYKEKDLETKVDEIISEKEPSVREFRNWMNMLSNDLNQKVIIVFDNMDRLPAEKVQSLWSSIHTFFSEDKHENIWVIVPFDRKQIREAFNEDRETNNFEKTNHFINKTFSVIFTVAPAVLTDWESFFKAKYFEAFGEMQNEEYNFVRNIFNVHHVSITPRKIIAFINELVSLKLLRTEIPVSYISLFILNRSILLEDPVRQILNQQYLTKTKNLFKGDDKVHEYIAALIYNVPVEDASQVTLYREIEVAIRERKDHLLLDMSKHPSFYEILEQVFSNDNLEIDASVATMNNLEVAVGDKVNKDVMNIVWNRILGMQMHIELNQLSFTDIHATLILKAPWLKQKIFIRYITSQFFNTRDFKGNDYYTALNAMDKFLTSNNIQVELASFIIPKVMAPEHFTQYLNAAKGSYKKYKVSAENDALDNYLAGKIPSVELLVIDFIKDEYTFPKVKTALEKFIVTDTITLDSLQTSIAAYKVISDIKPLNVQITDATIQNFLTAATKGTAVYYELVAMRLARADEFENPSGVSQTVLSQKDDATVSQVANRIEYYATYGTLLTTLFKWENPLLKAVLKKITIQKIDGSQFDIGEILPNYEKIILGLEITGEQLIEFISPQAEALKVILKEDTLLDLIPDSEFFECALATNNDFTEHVVGTAIKYFEKLDATEWDSLFNDDKSYEFQVFYLLIKHSKIEILSDNCTAALKKALQAIADGNLATPIELNDQWQTILDKSDKSQLKRTLKDIRDLFINKVDITTDQFIFFEKVLRSEAELNSRSEDITRRILLRVCEDEESFEHINANKTFYIDLILLSNAIGFDFIEAVRLKNETDTVLEDYQSFSLCIDEKLSPDLQIEYAKYYNPDKEDEGAEVTTNVKALVENEKKLHFLITNQIASNTDPAPGVPKKLFVKYSYKGIQKEKFCDEHKWLSIP